MTYNVLLIDNRNLKTYNIFSNWRFAQDVNILLKNKNITDFKEKVIKLLQYYFWSKCEYEIIVTSFPYKIKNNEIDNKFKIDVYYQVMQNIDILIDMLLKQEVINE